MNIHNNNQLRDQLLSEYKRFLQKAEANRDYIIKYGSLLNSVQCNYQMTKVEADIDFAARKILELSIPPVPVIPAREEPTRHSFAGVRDMGLFLPVAEVKAPEPEADARSQVQRVSAGIQAPSIPSELPVLIDVSNTPCDTPGEAIDVKPELNDVLNTPVSRSSDSSDNVWWLLGGVVTGLVAVPFVANWVSRDTEKNLATVQDVLKIIKMTSGYGRL